MKRQKGKIIIEVKYLLLVLILVFSSALLDIQIKPSELSNSILGRTITTPFAPSDLTSQVVPVQGYVVDINWENVGQKLVDKGAIDMDKFSQKYEEAQFADELEYLKTGKLSDITINQENGYFWVNVLWALGLTQKSDVLGDGIISSEYGDKIANFASTAGWTLGTKNAMSLFNSQNIINLSKEENNRITEISKNIYRPCCGNPTSFPDCNHGMAILGLIELMVDQGKSDDEIYAAALAFNSYWFGDAYTNIAYYFQTQEDISWKDVDPKRILSAEFSSSLGYQAIKEQIGNIPGSSSQGSSCSA